MKKSETLAELGSALAKAHAEMHNPKKGASNPFYGTKYADLSEVIKATKGILADQGLSVIQMPSQDGNYVSVETMLIHESGEYITSELSIPVPIGAKNVAQEIGKAITYARRYTLSAVCGVGQEDDDGESLSMPVEPTPAPKPIQKLWKKDVMRDEYISQIQTLVASDDEAGVVELKKELSDPQRIDLAKDLSKEELSYLKKVA